MTNYERIKSMSVEEMAKKIFEYGSTYVCTLCKNCYEKSICEKAKGTDCIQYITEWLESEVTDND